LRSLVAPVAVVAAVTVAAVAFLPVPLPD